LKEGRFTDVAYYSLQVWLVLVDYPNKCQSSLCFLRIPVEDFHCWLLSNPSRFKAGRPELATTRDKLCRGQETYFARRAESFDSTVAGTVAGVRFPTFSPTLLINIDNFIP